MDRFVQGHLNSVELLIATEFSVKLELLIIIEREMALRKKKRAPPPEVELV